jgi:hypothetical protein
MRRLVSIAVFLSTFAFVPLAAQDDGATVFVASYYKALEGKRAAYNTWVQEYVPLLMEERIRRGHLVSYQTLVQAAGAGEFTNVHILEFANWAAVEGVSDEEWDDVCRTAFGGKTCPEKLAEYGELATMRTFVRTEHYTSLKP